MRPPVSSCCCAFGSDDQDDDTYDNDGDDDESGLCFKCLSPGGFFPKTPLGLGSRLVLQREVRDIGPCLDGRALEDQTVHGP